VNPYREEKTFEIIIKSSYIVIE